MLLSLFTVLRCFQLISEEKHMRVIQKERWIWIPQGHHGQHVGNAWLAHAQYHHATYLSHCSGQEFHNVLVWRRNHTLAIYLNNPVADSNASSLRYTATH